MSINETLQSDAAITELNRQFLELFTNWLLAAIVLVAAVILVFGLTWTWAAMCARRKQVAVQARLRQIALEARGVQTARTECQAFDFGETHAPERHGHVWRFQVRRWAFVLTVDQIEKPV